MLEHATSGVSDDVVYNVDLFNPFLRVNLIDLLSLSDGTNDIKDLAIFEMEETIESFKRIDAFLSTIINLVMAISLIWAYVSYTMPVIEFMSKTQGGF